MPKKSSQEKYSRRKKILKDEDLKMELEDDDLAAVSGGLLFHNSREVSLCTLCCVRIAVEHMNICGDCYRERQLHS